ncbi:MAG: DUF4258 domain-containing protein [Flavobacterium sp.]|uniref:DUF4258 domain-containing protein n=1 Tax=Flavobacterium sp. TaxID=239 RepID=UPI001218B5C2|nr:DUF4258 domain-containing protein [Flavobacterium sp.]RZJ64217.1 MAG: DUF4258 domain-containing protein [Flavobacterium sp.]
MKLYQRFAYYLIGFTLGIFFVAAIWSGKDVRCNYFPNARVLNDLRTKPFYYSPATDTILSQGWITKADVKTILTYGDVDFDKSNIAVKGGKLYVIEGQTSKKQPVVLNLVNYSDKVLLKSVEKSTSK